MAPSTRWSASARCGWLDRPGRLYFQAGRRRLAGNRRNVSRGAALVARPLLDAFEGGMRVVDNAYTVSDGPFQTRGQQDVGAVEPVAHQIGPAIRKRDFHVTQLLTEVFARLGDDIRCKAVDVSQCAAPVTAHDIQTASIHFCDHAKTPFHPAA